VLFFILEDISYSRIPGLVELCTEGRKILVPGFQSQTKLSLGYQPQNI